LLRSQLLLLPLQQGSCFPLFSHLTSRRELSLRYIPLKFGCLAPCVGSLLLGGLGIMLPPFGGLVSQPFLYEHLLRSVFRSCKRLLQLLHGLLLLLL
jgi:hypothetical protein